MVLMFVGGGCRLLAEFLYYSSCRNPTGLEFFVPARMQLNPNKGQAVTSLLVSFQRWAWSADGAVSWRHNTMPSGDFVNTKKVAWGLFSTPPSTIWLRPCCTRILSKCTMSIWRHGGCNAGAILAAAFVVATRMMKINVMHRWCIMH